MGLNLLFIMRNIYFNSNLNPLVKSLAAAEAPSLKISSMEHLSNDHNDHPNLYENSHKLCDEAGNPLLCLKESQWKLGQQHDQNSPMEEKPV